MIEIDTLNEMFTILKQYIPPKDRQEAADNVVSVMVDLLSDDAFVEFTQSDTYLTKAGKEYLFEDVDIDDDSDDDE
jgi:hypothetical protein